MARLLATTVFAMLLAAVGVQADIPPVSHLAQFKMQCLSGIYNSQTSTRDRFDLVRDFFGVIQVGIDATPNVMNPYNVCTYNAPWMRTLYPKGTRMGNWNVKPVFLGNRSVILWYDQKFHQEDMYGITDYMPSNDSKHFGSPVPSSPLVYQVNESAVTYDGEHENSYGVLFAYDQGKSQSTFIPCFLSWHDSARCLTQDNVTMRNNVTATEVLSVMNSQGVLLAVGNVLVVSTRPFPDVIYSFAIQDPCGIVRNVHMEVMYENTTYSKEMGQDSADGKQRYVLIYGDNVDGFFTVCRLHGDLRDRDATNFSVWTEVTAIKAVVTQAVADDYTILFSVKLLLGDDPHFLLPMTSKTGKTQIPHGVPHQTEITPTAVGLPGQRRFILQYNGLLQGVEVGSLGRQYFQVLWNSNVGCLNDPAVWRSEYVLYCWSNGINNTMGELMMVDTLTGDFIPDTGHGPNQVPGNPTGHQPSYNGMHFGIPSLQTLSLPFQLSLYPKSDHPMVWFLGTKLPDQLLSSPPPNDVHCLIGMAIDVPRANKCGLHPNNHKKPDGSQGGSQSQSGTNSPDGHHAGDDDKSDKTAGKVVLAVVVIFFIGFIVAAMTIGYRKHRARSKSLSIHSPFEGDDDGEKPRESEAALSPAARTGTMLLYGDRQMSTASENQRPLTLPGTYGATVNDE